jgi:two-component system chemotaxis response regulator CheB
VLNQIQTDKEIRFRCQVGHAFTPLGLAAMQSEELERALGWRSAPIATGCACSTR